MFDLFQSTNFAKHSDVTYEVLDFALIGHDGVQNSSDNTNLVLNI